MKLPLHLALMILFTGLLSFANGQTSTVAGFGLVGLYAPQIIGKVIAEPGPSVQMKLNANGSLHELAVGIAESTGVEWQVNVRRPPAKVGRAYYTQLIRRALSYKTPVSSESGPSTSGEFWLDKDDPYHGQTMSFPLANANGPVEATRPVLFSDSPSLIEGNFGFSSYADVDDSFQTFVMWLLDGEGSIPVPIGLIKWGWHGRAEKGNGNWSLVLGQMREHTWDFSIQDHPRWTKRYDQ